MTKIIKVAQIGVGYWGPNILRNLLNNKKFELKLVIEKSNSRIKYVKKISNKIKVSSNFDEIFKDKSIKAVFITTPPRTHFKLAYECLKKGKHVFIEKPITKSLKELKILKKISQKKKLLVMAGDIYLYNAAINKIKKIIEKNYLGNLLYIFCQRLNFGRVRNDVDSIWSLSSHDISIIQFLMNYMMPIKFKSTKYNILKRKMADTSFIELKYKNKVNANILVSWLHPEKVRKFIIIGSKKMLIFDDLKPTEIQIINKAIIPTASSNKKIYFDYDKINFSNFKYSVKKDKIFKIKNVEPLKKELNHFYDCLKNRKLKIKTGVDHSENILKILEKIS